MKKSYLLILLMILIPNLGWSDLKNNNIEKKKLLKIDFAISEKASQKGIVPALLDHLSENGVVLPQNGHPLIGKTTFQSATANRDIKKIPPWTPTLAKISQAGDLAYTAGRYKLHRKEPDNKTKIGDGYYCLIWRKNPQGKWEIVFCRGLLLGKIANQQPPHLNQKRNLSPDEKDLIKTELQFSQYSLKHGMAGAFFNYIDDNGIALSASGPQKKDFYRQKMIKKPLEGWKSQLQWYPIFTSVSDSGDLGYNFGPYEYNITNPTGKSRIFYGYFITIWKKQANGSWKFLFDGGNQSPAPKKSPEIQ
jgi:ketosteroid isomerase-like protein